MNEQNAWFLERIGKQIRVVNTLKEHHDGNLDAVEPDGIVVNGEWMNTAHIVSVRDTSP